LCGGAGKNNIRNLIKYALVKDNFQILYPEDLFMEMYNRDKKSDLLEYENLLADNSDIVCIICESIGTAVELGAFVQNETIKKKMIVAINQKFSKEKSFVMMGPVKHLKKLKNDSIVFYKATDLNTLIKTLEKIFRKYTKQFKNNRNVTFHTMSTYFTFIPLIIYFYHSISRKEIHFNLKKLLESRNTFPKNYNELFNASIKYLLNSGIVITEFNIDKKDETLSLSSKGYSETLSLISHSTVSNKTNLHDKIRCAILKEELIKNCSF
jgi:hypothetical protein